MRVAAASVNPLDYKRRAGLTDDYYPIHFPGLIGVDMAGTVVKIGPEVEGFSVGDQVFAMADNTYAEHCVVSAAILAKVPWGLDLIQAAALPLVTITGNQLLSATRIKARQTVLVAGAVGNVGHSAVFTARQRAATVIAAHNTKMVQACLYFIKAEDFRNEVVAELVMMALLEKGGGCRRVTRPDMRLLDCVDKLDNLE